MSNTYFRRMWGSNNIMIWFFNAIRLGSFIEDEFTPPTCPVSRRNESVISGKMWNTLNFFASGTCIKSGQVCITFGSKIIWVTTDYTLPIDNYISHPSELCHCPFIYIRFRENKSVEWLIINERIFAKYVSERPSIVINKNPQSIVKMKSKRIVRYMLYDIYCNLTVGRFTIWVYITSPSETACMNYRNRRLCLLILVIHSVRYWKPWK